VNTLNRIVLIALMCALPLAVLAGCSGGGTSSTNKTATTAAGGGKSATPGGSKTPVPGASGTAGASGTVASGSTITADGTVIPGGTAGAGGTAASGSTVTADGTVVPGATSSTTSEPPPSSAPTPSSAEATIAASVPSDTSGGDPNLPPRVVSTVPAPPPGSTPKIDPTTIASADVPESQVELIIDMDASTPGIQSTREVNAGDVIRVGVVIANAPPSVNNLGGVNSFNFQVLYDKRKIVAPTIEDGSATNRNPALNLAALGAPDVDWICLPAPQGDLDDPHGIDGDGDPDTGQAFLSCFTTGGGHNGGTMVLATIEFHAVASGTSTLNFRTTAVNDEAQQSFASCDDEPGGAGIVPCIGATVTVK
jgi:hypothetical protein